MSLFSARIAQHMMLTTVAAPLIALGRPGVIPKIVLQWLWPQPVQRSFRSPADRPLLAASVFAAALWAWHAPGPYTATFGSSAVYWLMHLTLFGSAFWLWLALLDGAEEHLAGFALAGFLTSAQMGLLSAIITFAGRPLYAPHLLTAAAWGLSPLQDQALGGVLMWVPAGVIFAGALVAAFFRAMRRAETGALRPSAI